MTRAMRHTLGNILAIIALCSQAKAAAKLYSVDPASAKAGTTIMLDGFGFSQSNTVHFGAGIIKQVPITSRVAIDCARGVPCNGGIHEKLLVTVPKGVKGRVKVWVNNSNAVMFRVR